MKYCPGPFFFIRNASPIYFSWKTNSNNNKKANEKYRQITKMFFLQYKIYTDRFHYLSETFICKISTNNNVCLMNEPSHKKTCLWAADQLTQPSA